MVPKDKLGEIIGPKGKVIREIEEQTGATLEIEDDGTVRIGAADGEALRKAKDWVLAIAFPPEAEMGKEYEGEVVNITKFGAFVNILPGRDGLLHISSGRRLKAGRERRGRLTGGKIQVVVREIDDRGKVSLELVDALEGATLPDSEPPRSSGGGDRGRGSGDRDRGRGGSGDRGRGGSGDRDRGRDRNRDDRPAPEKASVAIAQPTSASAERRRVAQPFDEVFEDLQNN